MTAEKEMSCLAEGIFFCSVAGKNAAGKDVNEEAMVMKLSFGEFRMLFTGDIGADTEKKLLQPGCLRMLTV